MLHGVRCSMGYGVYGVWGMVYGVWGMVYHGNRVMVRASIKNFKKNANRI